MVMVCPMMIIWSMVMKMIDGRRLMIDRWLIFYILYVTSAGSLRFLFVVGVWWLMFDVNDQRLTCGSWLFIFRVDSQCVSLLFRSVLPVFRTLILIVDIQRFRCRVVCSAVCAYDCLCACLRFVLEFLVLLVISWLLVKPWAKCAFPLNEWIFLAS